MRWIVYAADGPPVASMGQVWGVSGTGLSDKAPVADTVCEAWQRSIAGPLSRPVRIPNRAVNRCFFGVDHLMIEGHPVAVLVKTDSGSVVQTQRGPSVPTHWSCQ